jgi:hypothetical protein
MRFVLHCVATFALFGVVVTRGAAGAGSPERPASAVPCRPPPLSSSYVRRVRAALVAKRDIWGNALLRMNSGPTYERAQRYLEPLFHAEGPQMRRLTDSDVYYLAFAQPHGPAGGGTVALHVADGSEIISDRVDGSKLALDVGPDGRERYGSCTARLSSPRLFRGYQPILETGYVDENGVRFTQESFATRVSETDSLVSFVRLTIDAPGGSRPERIRFTLSNPGLEAGDGQLLRGDNTYLFFSEGGHAAGSSVVYTAGGTDSPLTQRIYVARLDRPAPSRPLALDEHAYEQARRALISYWDERLAHGAAFVVPEKRVVDAERNLLIQNLLMTWRYSIGNDYQEFEFPESLENSAVMGEYGFADVDRAMVEESFRREPHLYRNWEAATRLLAAARYFRFFADRSFIAATAPTLERNTLLLVRQLRAHGSGLLRRERYTADLPDVAYGLQTQAVAWQALNAIADVWRATGRRTLGDRARLAATRLGVGLRAAVQASGVRLPDGSLFVPSRLLDGEHPYEAITESTHGSYWNLVVQDALASGFFAPHGPESTGALAYLLGHGSRLLGLVRAGAYSLYGPRARTMSGTDEVYGLNVARFLADSDQPDQLVLSLYGDLAAGMTENTFVSGEGATVSPIAGNHYRSMYLPPNSTSNATFLECLRLLLVHETTTPRGSPRGLELAYATPRAWLAPGKRIVVREAPTSFGPISYSIDSARSAVAVRLEVPNRAPIASLRLRLRRPRPQKIKRVELDGHPYPHFGRRAETIDLTGLTGHLTLTVYFAAS